MTEQMSDEMSGILVGVIREEAIEQDRKRIYALRAEWLAMNAKFYGGKMSDAEALDIERKNDLVLRELFSIPAFTGVQLLFKIEILEHYLSDSGSASLDCREQVMIASIKADLNSGFFTHNLVSSE